MWKRTWLAAAMAAAVAAVPGCSDQDGTPSAGDASSAKAPAAAEPAAVAGPDPARGKIVYMNVCIACHSGDPNEDGVLGPAIAGSNLELLYAKVIRNEYPAGYKPKRDSGSMPPYAYLEERIPDIAAWLAEQKR